MMIYPEFLPIYIGLGVLFVLMVAILVLLILVLQKVKKDAPTRTSEYQLGAYPQNYGGNAPTTPSSYSQPPVGNVSYGSGYGSVVFCKNCATQYDASAKCCPRCGTPR